MNRGTSMNAVKSFSSFPNGWSVAEAKAGTRYFEVQDVPIFEASSSPIGSRIFGVTSVPQGGAAERADVAGFGHFRGQERNLTRILGRGDRDDLKAKTIGAATTWLHHRAPGLAALQRCLELRLYRKPRRMMVAASGS